MLFASTSLAARIERAECRLLADSAASAARRPQGFENVLGRSLPARPPAPLPADVAIAPSPLEELGVWAPGA
jgi:hypothetical protein